MSYIMLENCQKLWIIVASAWENLILFWQVIGSNDRDSSRLALGLLRAGLFLVFYCSWGSSWGVSNEDLWCRGPTLLYQSWTWSFISLSSPLSHPVSLEGCQCSGTLVFCLAISPRGKKMLEKVQFTFIYFLLPYLSSSPGCFGWSLILWNIYFLYLFRFYSS